MSSRPGMWLELPDLLWLTHQVLLPQEPEQICYSPQDGKTKEWQRPGIAVAFPSLGLSVSHFPLEQNSLSHPSKSACCGSDGERGEQAGNAAGEHFYAPFLGRSILSVPITFRTSCDFWPCHTQPSPSGFLSLSLSLWRTRLLLKTLQVSLRASPIIHQPVKQDRRILPQPRDAPLSCYQWGYL